MNITLDAKLSSSPVADTDRTTTYKTTADSLQVGNSGYSLDITDNKVMDDKAYQGSRIDRTGYYVEGREHKC